MSKVKTFFLMLILIILSLSSIVSGENQHNEDDDNRIRLTYYTSYFGPIEEYGTNFDWRINDIYYPSGDFMYVFTVRTFDENRIPISGLMITFTIRMLNFVNTSYGITDKNGSVKFQFESTLSDTSSQEVFKVRNGLLEENLTEEIKFEGNEEYQPFQRMWPSSFFQEENDSNESINIDTLILLIIAISFIGLIMCGIIITLMIKYRKRKIQ